MKDQLIAFLVKLGVAALDRWLDARIQAQGWTAASKARAHLLEDELIRLLEPALGELARKFAPALVGRAFDRMFPNDSSTGNWG